MAEAIYLAMTILRVWVDWMVPRMVSMKEQTTGCRLADSLGDRRAVSESELVNQLCVRKAECK